MPVRMKILIVTELFPDSDVAEVTGGVENRVYYVVRRLRQRHDVKVLAGGTASGTQWRPASIRSIPLRLRRMLSLFWRGLRADFDVVESSILVVHPIAFLLGRLKRRPAVFWYPDVLIGQWRGGAFSRLAGVIGEVYERLVLKLPVDRYIVISESTRDKLLARGVKPERIAIIHCGFDRRVAETARLEAATGSPRSPSIATASRLVPYKRLDVVIQAVSLLSDRHPDLRLRIIGQGPERARLESLAAELGIATRVEFLGFVPSHDDVVREIAKASVFVSASEIEGFGISVVEAAAVDVPFVITDMPVFREVTEGGNGGLLFKMGDAADLAKQIDRLLVDPDLRAACHEQASKLVESYDWDALGDETAELYSDVIATHHRRA
jgi:glycosyltransferase involved in cell wall biosynthesis